MPSASIPATMIGADVAAGASTAAAAAAADATASFGTAAVVGSNLAAALPTLGTIATIGSLAATGVSTVGALQQSKAQSAAAGYNAQVAANNAEIAKQNSDIQGAVGEQKAATSQAQTRAKAGAILANEGASGVDINSGSFLGVRSSASELGKLDAMQIRSDAAQAAYGFNVQATSDTAQSQLDRMEQESAKTGGYYNAASTVLGGVGKAAQYSNWLSGGGPLAGLTG